MRSHWGIEDLDLDDLSLVQVVQVVRHHPITARVRDLCREILEERVVSSRDRHHPRGIKRKTGTYPIRRSGPLDRRRYTWMPLLLTPTY